MQEKPQYLLKRVREWRVSSKTGFCMVLFFAETSQGLSGRANKYYKDQGILDCQ